VHDAERWHQLEIESVGRTLTVQLDGSRVYTSETVENPQGHIALWASSGVLEVRSATIREHPLPPLESPVGVFGEEDGVVLPRVSREVKPRYTAEALAARIAGDVLMTAVVLPDGTVGEVLVRRSLDPKHGLDREAVAAAKQWRFRPGTREGKPVAVRVWIQLTFSLR
jgi:TonB family protein